jgi:hypothetical protein
VPESEFAATAVGADPEKAGAGTDVSGVASEDPGKSRAVVEAACDDSDSVPALGATLGRSLAFVSSSADEDDCRSRTGSTAGAGRKSNERRQPVVEASNAVDTRSQRARR